MALDVGSEQAAAAPAGTAAATLHREPWRADFANASYEWRRLSAEVLGTFFLVVVAAGAGSVASRYPGVLDRNALVVAPGLMVMALILATGAVSGAHLNPAVTLAFALRLEFPWRRVPLYLVAQVAGALLACEVLRAALGHGVALGLTVPGAHSSAAAAVWFEAVLTCGLVTVILGTASGAQNVGPLSALAVGGYIALAGLWASPVSGASMNPVRSLVPDLVSGRWPDYWVYLAGPFLGMAVAVGFAYVLRGRGADPTATRAAQGSLGLGQPGGRSRDG